MKHATVAVLIIILGALSAIQSPGGESPAASPAPAYSHWKNGLSSDENYFPIAVWLQNPRHAARYKAAGINVYVALWRGPTTNQLAELQAAGMSLICAQNK